MTIRYRLTWKKMLICIENLLMNAIEYSDAHTTVGITYAETPMGYEIRISNIGRAITEEDKKSLFDRHFTQGGSGHSGLGLPICRKIVHAHMGEITVDSQNNQIIFTITLYKK